MTRGREVAPEDLLLTCIPSSLAIRTGSGFWGGRLPQQHSLASIFCCSRGCWERMKWLGQGFRTASALFYAFFTCTWHPTCYLYRKCRHSPVPRSSAPLTHRKLLGGR